MGSISRKGQLIIIIAITIVFFISITLTLYLLGYPTEIIQTVDLSFGVVGLLLALYVYYKEKKLEDEIKTSKDDEINNAYADILTSMLMFGGTLDQMFIQNYDPRVNNIKISEDPKMSLHHRNLRLVFEAHIAVIEKSIMGRLAQHISLLETYTKTDSVPVQQHMDNMHGMDRLIDKLKKETDMDLEQGSEFEKFMRKQRHNRFMQFLLNEIRNCVNKRRKPGYESFKSDIIARNNDFEYYMRDTPSDVLATIKPKLVHIEKIIEEHGETDVGLDECDKVAEQIYNDILEYDQSITSENRDTIAVLRDFSKIVNPLLFLIEILNDLDESAMWSGTLRLRVASILDATSLCRTIDKKIKEHIDVELKRILDNNLSKSECLKQLLKIKKYLVSERLKIQGKHLQVNHTHALQE